MFNSRIPAEERCQATDLVRERSPYVLRTILTQVPHARDYSQEHRLLLEELGEP